MSRMPIFLDARTWLCLIAIAALALTTGSLLAGEASAASGGIGTTSSSSPAPRSSSGKPDGRYDQVWFSLPRGERRWAHRTGICESGGNPRAIGGGGLYRGAFQFMKETWKSSPRSPGGDPVRFTYRTQAVVAVLLKRRDGAGHWPVCG